MDLLNTVGCNAWLVISWFSEAVNRVRFLGLEIVFDSSPTGTNFDCFYRLALLRINEANDGI